MGGISDVELTRVSGFIERLPKNTNPKISVMADRGFTVQDQLNSVGVDLNIPPFLFGHKQLSRKEVEQTRKIASVRIHVERAIGRIKNFAILKGTLPISMARMANQIVCVCAWLTSFQPALVLQPDAASDSLDEYIASYFEWMNQIMMETMKAVKMRTTSTLTAYLHTIIILCILYQYLLNSFIT